MALVISDLAIKFGNMSMVDGAILTPCFLEQRSQIETVRCRLNNFEI